MRVSQRRKLRGTAYGRWLAFWGPLSNPHFPYRVPCYRPEYYPCAPNDLLRDRQGRVPTIWRSHGAKKPRHVASARSKPPLRPPCQRMTAQHPSRAIAYALACRPLRTPLQRNRAQAPYPTQNRCREAPRDRRSGNPYALSGSLPHSVARQGAHAHVIKTIARHRGGGHREAVSLSIVARKNH